MRHTDYKIIAEANYFDINKNNVRHHCVSSPFFCGDLTRHGSSPISERLLLCTVGLPFSLILFSFVTCPHFLSSSFSPLSALSTLGGPSLLPYGQVLSASANITTATKMCVCTCICASIDLWAFPSVCVWGGDFEACIIFRADKYENA